MSLDLGAIEGALVALVKTILTTDEVIIADQNAPRPADPYTIIKIVDIGTAGVEFSAFENQTGADIDLIETVTAPRDLLVSFNCYFANAMTRVNKLRLLLTSTASLASLKAANLGLARRSEVRDMVSVVDGLFEERGQFDVNLYAIDSETIITNTIQAVEIEGEIQDGVNSFDLEINVP